MVGLTQINRPERGFTTVIKANAKFDLRHAARSKIANISTVSTPSAIVVVTAVQRSARTTIAVVSTIVTGVASAGAVVSITVPVSTTDVPRDDTTLIIENGIIRKLGGDSKDGVERISLNTCLYRGSRGSGSYGLGAGVASGSVGLASVHELVAHGTGDNGDVLS